MVYISEQATAILNCKKEFLDSSRFVELLAPQDVSVFYKHTTQSHLQPWNMGTDTAPSLYEYSQVKSFFCRIRGGKDGDRELRYFPFRITPYSVRVGNSMTTEVESCCLALAERIHSGYEAPRIPLDKWIFTTTHTPGCGFLEVDDRAVPLLGYLPQDLIGTSVLTYLHSEDRPLMLAMHRKIMRYAGQQPFEHAPMRFCTKNGDYVTLDTSWSSFVNPWSRKVAFIIGRHKVRTGPLNEDVFAARSREFSSNENEIRELQGQIYKLLLQPIHNNGSSGYGSFGSNGSYEHYISIASSSDSNGNCVEEIQREPMTLQQVCVDLNRIKNVGQQAYIESRSRRQGKKKEGLHNKLQRGKPPTSASYFPLSIGLPAAEGHATSSCDASRKGQHVPSYQQINCVDSIIRYLESYSIPARKRKCISSINTTSSSSLEEDRVAQRERRRSKVLEDVSTAPTPVSQSQMLAGPTGRTDACTEAAAVGAPLTDLTLSIKAMSVVSDTKVTALEDVNLGIEQIEMRSLTASVVAPEEFKQVGLTKEVLSAHTQKEEQEYVDRFRLRILQSPYSSYLQQGNRSKGCSNELGDQSSKQIKPAGGRKGKKHGKRGKQKRQKPQESSDSSGSNQKHQPHVKKMGAVQQSWPSSEVSQPNSSNVPFPQPMTILNPPAYPVPGFPVSSITSVSGECATSSVGQEPRTQSTMSYNLHSFPAFQAPYMGPVMAVMLPNYPMYSHMGSQMPQTLITSHYPCSSSYSFAAVPVPPASMPLQVTTGVMAPPSQVSSPMLPDDQLVVPDKEPPLFSNSRSSSPLQLDLLQEELPMSVEHQEVPEDEAHVENKTVNAADEHGNNDSRSASIELLDLLMQEDSQSGTGSARSGSGSAEFSSLGSGCNGCSSHGTSGSAIGSSKYFASNDSSSTSQNSRDRQQMEGKEHFHIAVADPLWALIKHTSTSVLMTYQVPNRDKDALLKEDLKKLTAMQNVQPSFTEEQKEELAEVHAWIRSRTIPQEINVDGCIICDKRRGDCDAMANNISNPEDKGSSVSEPRHPPCTLHVHHGSKLAEH
ncbi:period circadian protein homolog 3 isoform X1 [Lissotriton helveticus]